MSNPHPVCGYKPGESGNPAGRKVGSRNKIAERFFNDYYSQWLQHGVAVLECAFTAAITDPHQAIALIRATTAMFPRQLQIQSDTTFRTLSAERLKQIVEHFTEPAGAAGDSAGSPARAVAPLGSDKPDSVH
jgi:hypothetical protein